MNENYILFRKQRELGEILSDTFKFIRENYKSLFRMIFKVAGPVFLFLVLVLAYYSYLAGESFSNPLLSDNLAGNEALFFVAFFLLMISVLVFYVQLYGTVLHFIKSYIQNQGKVNESEVLSGVKKDFGRMLGLLLLVGLITIIGLILCLLPGIYLWVPLSLAPALLVFKRDPISDAMTESFSLIKDNWWITFLSLFVIMVIVYIIGLFFQMPLIIYYFFKTLTMVQEGAAADPASLFDWVYVVFNVISSMAQYLLSTIVIIASAFIYYNLDEKKNLTGSYERISNLGSQEK